MLTTKYESFTILKYMVAGEVLKIKEEQFKFSVLRIRLILIRIHIHLWVRPKIKEMFLLFFFIYKKNFLKKKLFSFVIYGLIIYAL